MRSRVTVLLSLFSVFIFASSLLAQCGPCQPGVKPGFTPGAPMTVYLDYTLSVTETNAATAAIAGWNQWFVQTGRPAPYTLTNNAFAANVTIREDPRLHNSGICGSTNATAGTIDTNPDYQNRRDGFLDQVLSHEFGHAIGFTDVALSNCNGQTVMFANITLGGPYTTGPTATDQCQLSQFNGSSAGMQNDANSACGVDTGCTEPIVFNLSNGGYELTGLDDPVAFDIIGAGYRAIKPQIGWTARGSEMAFLAFDRDGNGMIDSGGELFGTGTLLRGGKHASDGFEALAQYDDNGDGQIDASDRVWQFLLLWVDRNHDGISQAEELSPIRESAITSIGLTHHWISRRDHFGNVFGYEGLLHEGSRVRTFYDVFFVTAH
jgi:hypothetical protein